MLLSFLLWENAHFAVYALAALAALAAFWLHFDSWSLTRKGMGATMLAGWALLVTAFLWEAALVDRAPAALLPRIRMLAYALIALSTWFNGLQKKPEVTGLSIAPAVFSAAGIGDGLIVFLAPTLLAWATALAFLRKATRGLEKHIMPMAGVFAMLGLYELFWAARGLRDSLNPFWYQLAQPYGRAWLAEHILLALSGIILLIWVARYLLRRLSTQIFLLFASLTLVMFVMATAFFSAVLLKHAQQGQLERIQADARTLVYTLNTLQRTALSDAQLLAQDGKLTQPLAEGDMETAAETARDFLLSKRLDSLIVTDAEGQIILRAEDPDKTGGSLSEDPLVSAAREGEPKFGLSKQEGALAPLITIKAAAPVKNKSGATTAVVLTGFILDNVFLDGMKEETGLDVALLAGSQLASSTISTEDNGDRRVGTRDINTDLIKAALEGEEVAGTNVIMLDTRYLAAYRPLLNPEREVIGALFVGIPLTQALESARNAMQLTMTIIVVLLAVSLIPAKWLAYRIGEQVR